MFPLPRPRVGRFPRWVRTGLPPDVRIPAWVTLHQQGPECSMLPLKLVPPKPGGRSNRRGGECAALGVAHSPLETFRGRHEVRWCLCTQSRSTQAAVTMSAIWGTVANVVKSPPSALRKPPYWRWGNTHQLPRADSRQSGQRSQLVAVGQPRGLNESWWRCARW